MKASYHNGRTGSAKHNDRNFDLEKSDHIRSGYNNLYWNCYDGFYDDKTKTGQMAFEDVERKFYTENYAQAQEAINARYIKNRHQEKCKTIDDLLKGAHTRPEETILQIGSQKTGYPSAEVLGRCLLELLEEFKKYESNIHILDFAIHLDELTPHAQLRKVYDYDTPEGKRMGQDKALKALGFNLKNQNKKRGQYNNRKQSFDEHIRERWYTILKEHGLEIDTVPKEEAPGHLDSLNFKTQEEKKRYEETHQARLEEESKLQETHKRIDKLYEESDQHIKRTLTGKKVNISVEDFNLMVNGKKEAEEAVTKAEEQERKARDEMYNYRDENRQIKKELYETTNQRNWYMDAAQNASKNAVTVENELRRIKNRQPKSTKSIDEGYWKRDYGEDVIYDLNETRPPSRSIDRGISR